MNHTGPARARPWRRLLQDYGALAALAVLIAFSAWRSDVFLRPENLLNILLNVSFIGVIAVGMTLVIIMGGIDLSVGSMVAFVGGVSILALNAVLRAGWNEPAATIAAAATALALGTLLGMLNGLIVTLGRVTPFVATLGAMAAWRSAALAVADGGEYRSASPDVFPYLGNHGVPLPGLTNAYAETLVLPYPVVVFVAAAMLGGVLLRWTPYGRHVVAIGCNERAAVYSAVRVNRVKLTTYALIGLACGVAALLRASQMNSVASGSTGLMYELDAIAAVVIGGASMQGGRGRVFGTVVGVLILGVIGNMLNLLNVSNYWQGMVKGAIIVGAVLMQRGPSRD
jgi:ribose transport system permease protein